MEYNVIELAPGQLWKDRQRKHRAFFMVHWTDHITVRGCLVQESYVDPHRSMRVESMLKMFPHLWWSSPIDGEEDK